MPTEQQRDSPKSKTFRIRQTDLCPPEGKPFNPDHCVTALDIRTRLAALERDNTLIKNAFILNDINLPDFDGHRNDHRLRKESAKIMENYKISATHKVIAAIVATFVFLVSTGITAKIQAIVQTKETK